MASFKQGGRVDWNSGDVLKQRFVQLQFNNIIRATSALKNQLLVHA